ncbi:MAG: IS200/IS605 family transposase [Cyanobacteria bacterium P01_G01_bin.19]
MNHGAFEMYYHLTLQVKYRHKLITEKMLQRMESIFRDTLVKWRCSMISFSGEVDHVHLLFEAHPSLDLSRLIANLKTVSSRLIRKEYSDYLSNYFWKPYFWSSSYGIKTVSRGADMDVIVKYIQQQERPQPSKPEPSPELTSD